MTINGQILIEIGNAVSVPRTLTRQVEVSDLCLTLGVEHPQAVAISTNREVAIGHARGQQRFAQASFHPLLENRFCLFSQHRFIVITGLLLSFPDLPLSCEECIAIEESKHLIDGDV